MSENIDIVCPKCKSDDLDVYDQDGSIVDGWSIEETTCLTCGENFRVEADFANIRIIE